MKNTSFVSIIILLIMSCGCVDNTPKEERGLVEPKVAFAQLQVDLSSGNDMTRRILQCSEMQQIIGILGEPTEQKESILEGDAMAFYETVCYYPEQTMNFATFYYEGNIDAEQQKQEGTISAFEFGENSNVVLNDTIEPGKCTKYQLIKKFGLGTSGSHVFPLHFGSFDLVYSESRLGFKFRSESDTLSSIGIVFEKEEAF